MLPALTGLLLSACGASGPSAPAQRVILVTCDTLRADRLGTYGYERETSPELDAFARGSVVFERAYSAAPMTLPSVCSMLTGRLPASIGVENNYHFLHANARTLAEALGAHGIPTAAVVSNWVLVNPPSMPPEHGVRQGFEHFDDTLPSRELVRGMPERRAKSTTDAAIAWLEQRDDPSGPCFLWVHYQDPHGPYTPPPRFLEMLRRPSSGDPPLPLGQGISGLGSIPRYQHLGTERDPDVYRTHYDAEIRFFDYQLGRLLAYLEERKLLRDALVVFSADHGESLGEGGYWFSHGETLNLELVHVPLVVRFPDGSGPRPGSTGRVASQLDIWPTVMEAFGLDPGDCPGTSLWHAGADDEIAVQTLGMGEDIPSRVAVIDGDWRLHLIGDEPRGLFDIARDPGEDTDLRAEYPEVVARLLAGYRELTARDAATPGGSREREMSAEERRIMEGLGYAGSSSDD